MAEDLEVRPLASLEDVMEASRLIDEVWGEEGIVRPPLLRALALHGNPLFGAWRGAELIGAQMGFVGVSEEGTTLHSHITAARTGHQHRGVGFALKLAQRDWCLERGIDVVTWTFDPLIARNAYFNLVKLGAVAVAFHRNYYGEMADRINEGERSDRLEVRWELRSPRVEVALRGGDPGDRDPDPEALLVPCPEDYLALREGDPQAARAARDRVAGELEDAFSREYVGTGFRRGRGYVLERP